jgi:flagellar capping protein FliD
VLEISASATKIAEMEGKVVKQKIEVESNINEFKAKYDAEKPALIQRIDSFESRFEKFETKIDGRFDRLEGKIDSSIKK